MQQRYGESFHDALKARTGDLPAALLRSITWDQRTEMARHRTTTACTHLLLRLSLTWQRGSNENTNGLLRDYFPKGTDLGVHSPQHLLAAESGLNNRPRRVLSDRAPADLFGVLLASANPPVLRR